MLRLCCLRVPTFQLGRREREHGTQATLNCLGKEAVHHFSLYSQWETEKYKLPKPVEREKGVVNTALSLPQVLQIIRVMTAQSR